MWGLGMEIVLDKLGKVCYDGQVRVEDWEHADSWEDHRGCIGCEWGMV